MIAAGYEAKANHYSEQPNNTISGKAVRDGKVACRVGER
jgi:hypothetical protein